MPTAIVTGSGGLIGSAAARFFAGQGMEVIGIDNGLRETFFGTEAGTAWNVRELTSTTPGYVHCHLDIRDSVALRKIFASRCRDIELILHAAAQPSHDWAARDPHMDFSINALGTLNLLEITREMCPEAVFLFTSTNKVYGDKVNHLPYMEKETRYEPAPGHPWAEYGVDESMGVDQTRHSLFGVSKTSADLLVQEYSRCFGLRTGIFRGGCLTGSGHSAAQLHGFLGYVMRCALTGTPYTVFGYKGKQVRDNIHAVDLVSAFWQFFLRPEPGEVYNIGGGVNANISVLEAIEKCRQLTGKKMDITLDNAPRAGDHQWWISDTRKFQTHYPAWRYVYNMEAIMQELYAGMKARLA